MKNLTFKNKSVSFIIIVTGLFLTANLTAQEAPESDPLYSATIRADIEAAKKALAEGADINSQSNNGYTALMWASAYSNRSPYDEMAKFLISAGADVNIRANDGTTAILEAAESSKEITLMLVEKGADITARRDDGRVYSQAVFMASLWAPLTQSWQNSCSQRVQISMRQPPPEIQKAGQPSIMPAVTGMKNLSGFL
ncbi:MAG: ankyrin repeat domain-containing protein [Bacteroidales bacterium]